MIDVVHLTAHLGGGVGKALSELVVAEINSGADVRHTVVCLEKPEKSQFPDVIKQAGGEVVIAPEIADLESRLAAADIVQLEWWNHPATIECLCTLQPVAARLIVWCHVSGLCNPTIPQGLINRATRFILTSPCSHEIDSLASVSGGKATKVRVISSAGGVERLAKRRRNTVDERGLSVGYLGSLNFAKLHPNFVTWMAAVPRSDFRVKLVGDPVNQQALQDQAIHRDRPDLFEFVGYTSNVTEELEKLDVIAYLLNPRHYGTAENALIEAMAMGVVPVVLNNPAERHIVEHGVTGLVLQSGEEFASALDWLEANPNEFAAMRQQAANTAREKFTAGNMSRAFSKQYSALLSEPKVTLSFGDVFGSSPADWFLSCQGESAIYGSDGLLNITSADQIPHDQFERTKGSVFHFRAHFPDDPRLNMWANALEDAQC